MGSSPATTGTHAADDSGLPPSFDEAILEVAGDEVRLVAAWCPSCRQWSFPRTDHCPRCGIQAERRLLDQTGTVWSSVVIDAAVTIHPLPATIVQVDFSGTRVNGWLRSGEPVMGAACRVAPLVLHRDDGEPVTAYCFEISEGPADA